MALESLDSVPSPVAEALQPAVVGLAAGIRGDGPTETAARVAHARLVARLKEFAANGDPVVSLGADALARLMGVPEATTVDLGALSRRADNEHARLSRHARPSLPSRRPVDADREGRTAPDGRPRCRW